MDSLAQCMLFLRAFKCTLLKVDGLDLGLSIIQSLYLKMPWESDSLLSSSPGIYWLPLLSAPWIRTKIPCSFGGFCFVFRFVVVVGFFNFFHYL